MYTTKRLTGNGNMQDTPLVVQVIKWVLRLIGSITVLTYLPVVTFISITWVSYLQ